MSRIDACVLKQTSGLKHIELKGLYEFDEAIPKELISQILLLPRETLVADLVHILEGAEDYHSCYKLDFDVADDFLFERDFEYGFQSIHALFLLSELCATEALQAVVAYMEKLSLLDHVYSDCVTEYLWMYFHGIYDQTKEVLETLLCDKNFDNTTRISVSTGIGSWYILNEAYRGESLLFWERVLLKMADNLDVDAIKDCEMLSYVACNIIDAKLKELLPLMESLDERGFLQANVIGEIDDIKDELLDGGPAIAEMPLLNIFEIYEELADINEFDEFDFFGDNFDEEDGDDFEDEGDEDFFNMEGPPILIEPVRSEPKIGRNEPCPCGSGKKYKKCCG